VISRSISNQNHEVDLNHLFIDDLGNRSNPDNASSVIALEQQYRTTPLSAGSLEKNESKCEKLYRAYTLMWKTTRI
jgi:hypothetical protein